MLPLLEEIIPTVDIPVAARPRPESRCSEDMSKHAFLGTDPTLRRQNVEYRSEL